MVFPFTQLYVLVYSFRTWLVWQTTRKMKELTWLWWIKMMYLNLGIITCVWCTALCYIMIKKSLWKSIYTADLLSRVIFITNMTLARSGLQEITTIFSHNELIKNVTRTMNPTVSHSWITWGLGTSGDRSLPLTYIRRVFWYRLFPYTARLSIVAG